MAPRGLFAAASAVASASSSAATTAESLAGHKSAPSSRNLATLSWPSGSCSNARTDAAGSLASALARIRSACHRGLVSPPDGGRGKDCSSSTKSSASSETAMPEAFGRRLQAGADAQRGPFRSERASAEGEAPGGSSPKSKASDLAAWLPVCAADRLLLEFGPGTESSAAPPRRVLAGDLVLVVPSAAIRTHCGVVAGHIPAAPLPVSAQREVTCICRRNAGTHAPAQVALQGSIRPPHTVAAPRQAGPCSGSCR